MCAMRIRPKGMSEVAAVGMAQAELERLVTSPSTGPLLANLSAGIAKLGRGGSLGGTGVLAIHFGFAVD